MRKNIEKTDSENIDKKNIDKKRIDICKKCGIKLYASNSLEAGYCSVCAGMYEDARKVWEEKGLAKFCRSCGSMIHYKESIETGMCSVCRLTKT